MLLIFSLQNTAVVCCIYFFSDTKMLIADSCLQAVLDVCESLRSTSVTKFRCLKNLALQSVINTEKINFNKEAVTQKRFL